MPGSTEYRTPTEETVPLAVAYDTRERTWNLPMPLLFQRPVGLENRPIPIGSIRDLLITAGITGTDGKPLIFKPTTSGGQSSARPDGG